MKLKKIIPEMLLSFVFAFMLFFYEPIILYANNINDFWFDFYILISPVLVMFATTFLTASLLLIALHLLSLKFNLERYFRVLLLTLFACFIITYIHGNFLVGSLPSLNGETIVWNNFQVENIISIVICLAVFGVTAFCIKKFSASKVIRWASYTTAAIFLMMSVSFVSVILTTPALEEKQYITYATDDNFNTASTNKNFMILLVDAVDSYRFYNAVKDDPEYTSAFQDFTYFPDTVSAYSLTRDSIPFIFSGVWNHNETIFSEYSTKAFDDSSLFDSLRKDNYDMNFYEEDLVWYSRKALDFTNIRSSIRDVQFIPFIKQELKYILFKYLPYPAKSLSKIETMDFSGTKIASDDPVFEWGDVSNYTKIVDNKLSLKNQNYFQFVHLEGSHVPYNINENLEPTESGTYNQKSHATLKIINEYINRLKEARVYDNSIIIVMADHGCSLVAEGQAANVSVNQNPILYIKGYDEHHESLLVSDKSVWYQDLIDAYDDLLLAKKSGELFSDIPSDRIRKVIHNGWKKEDHMVEYEQRGKAWEQNTIFPTGRVFDLE